MWWWYTISVETVKVEKEHLSLKYINIYFAKIKYNGIFF
jgi:hypothetical protein